MTAPQALANLRVVDLSRVLAAPYCTMLLADYGAEVIKVERPLLGDDTRQWGPPWLGDQSAYYLSVNRNKKSLTLNLKTPQGQAIARQLIAQADIVVENFLPGTLQKMGLDYASLAPSQPGLIYCSVTGYGQTGPYAYRPGYDLIIQAQGGIMSVTGPADGAPHKVGVAITDITTGLFAVNAILAALYHRQQTGQGQYIDVALLDSQVAWLGNVAQNVLVTGQPAQRYGNAHASIVPYEIFPTSDGHIAIAIATDDQYRRFCLAAQRPDLWENPRWQSNDGRVSGRDELIPILQALFQSRTGETWLALCLQAGIPANPINNVATILNDPHVRAREMVQTVAHPTLGDIELLGPVAKLSATPAQIQTAPPLLGAHTDEILSQRLGYSPEQIVQFRMDEVI